MVSTTICIIGGGPAGVEFAAALMSKLKEGRPQITLFEKGDCIGASILSNWGHVRLFSTWALNVSPTGVAALRNADAAAKYDEDVCPTGSEYVHEYVQPLAQALDIDIELECTVVSVSRVACHKQNMGQNRGASQFQILFSCAGVEKYAKFDVVIDCSGCFENRPYFGRNGLPAIGERKIPAHQITHKIAKSHIKDLELIQEMKKVAVAVFGSGYSAATSVKNLLENPNIGEIYWFTRKSVNGGEGLYQVIEDDPLAERKSLCELANKLASSSSSSDQRKKCIHIGNVVASEVAITSGGQLELHLESLVDGGDAPSRSSVVVDFIHKNVGLRPDMSIASELQVHYCYASDGPMKLAASLGGGGDCLAQKSAGVETLLNPEPNFFVGGIKSYGRNSSYLHKMGIAQAEEIATYLKENAQ